MQNSELRLCIFSLKPSLILKVRHILKQLYFFNIVHVLRVKIKTLFVNY